MNCRQDYAGLETRLKMKLPFLRTQESMSMLAVYLGCLFRFILNSYLWQEQFLFHY